MTRSPPPCEADRVTTTPRLVILDDYQQVALASADWSTVRQRYEIDVVGEHLDQQATAARLQGATVVVLMRERTPFPRRLFEALPDLRLLVTTGGRNASVDVQAAADHGVTVCGTGASGTAVPEIAFGMMIALARHFVPEDNAVRAGGWQHTIGPGLAGHTLGLLGLGRLGSAMVPIAAAFGMDVVAWSPNLTAERATAAGATLVARADLFARSDYLSVHMVLSDRTRGLVTATDLAGMKPTAYLVNTSRGPVVDEDALLAVLRDGRIAGAALDVFGTEPLPADSPWRSAPRTLLLPHLGYVTTEGYTVFYRDVVEDVDAFDAGHPVRVITS